MVTMTTAQTGASGDVEVLATIEVGVAPTVVTGVEAHLINHYKTQVGRMYDSCKRHHPHPCLHLCWCHYCLKYIL